VPTVINPEQTSFPAYQSRRLGSRVAEYLRRPECEAAGRRLRREFEILTDREAAVHIADQQVYAAELSLSTLYADEAAAKAPVGRKPDPDQVARLEQAIVEAKDELSRLRARRPSISTGALEARHAACSKLILSSLNGGARLKFISSPSVPRGTTLEGTREKLLQLHADLKAVSDAPFPADHVRAKVAKFLADKSRPINVRMAIEGDEAPYLPLMTLTSEITIPNAFGILLWVLGPRIKELLDEQIEDMSDPKNALSPEQRVARTAAIKKEILSTERIEVAVEWQMLEAGEIPEFRRDANPRAILNVEAAA
jgi:hypothetical protein